MQDEHHTPCPRCFEAEELRTRLEIAEDTLRAIREGEVDAVVVGDKIYTLESSYADSHKFRGQVLEQISDMVVATDNELRVTYLNPAAEKQYGVAYSDILGRSLSALFEYRWKRPKDRARYKRSMEKAGRWRGEIIHACRDGRVIDVELIISRMRDERGQLTGHLAVIRDVTERNRAEERLREAYSELDRRVIERTRALAEANEALKAESDIRIRSERQRRQLLQKLVTVQEDERRRIARDIHDHLGQRLTALRLQIASLAETVQGGSDMAERVGVLVDMAGDLDSDVSFLAWELRPAVLDEFGLAEAVAAFLKGWSAQYGIRTEIEIRGFAQRRLPAETEIHLYRIFQESLNNIVKHADAGRVSVVLDWRGDEAALIVEDDGRGFALPGSGRGGRRTKGIGLAGMKERGALIGGRVEVESKSGRGTTVYVRVPAGGESSVPTVRDAPRKRSRRTGGFDMAESS